MQTILSTIKKATVIYLKTINSLLFILISAQSFAAEDLASFCFARETNLREAQKSLEYLLLPREQVFPRPVDNCFDVTTSPDRVKLLEKFLSKRYTLVSETGVSKGETEAAQKNCQIEFITIKEREVDSKDFRAGINNNAVIGMKSTIENSRSELLLGLGKPGTLDVYGKALQVECRGGYRGIYQLTFFYSEEYRSRVSTEITLKQGETLEIAQVTNELNDKSKTLGLPQMIYQEAKGKEKISYRLMIK